MSHKDKVSTSCAPFVRFIKPFFGYGAASSSGVLVPASFSLRARRGGAGVERWWAGSGVAGFPALCTDPRVLLGVSVMYVRMLYLYFIL